MKKNKIIALLMSVIMVMVISTGFSSKSAVAKAPTGKQEMNIAFTQDMGSLDSSKMAETSAGTILMETQEGLVRMENKKIKPAGAIKWETSNNGLTWIFHLRNYKYADGTKVTAKDYVYAVRRAFDPVVGCPNASIFYVIKGGQAYNTNKGTKEGVGVKTINDNTLQFTLNTPCPYFLQLMNFVSMLPMKNGVVEKVGSSYGQDAKVVPYSGPFVVKEWVKGSKIVLAKNEKYWDAKNVKLKTVNINIVPEEATRQQLFNSKGIDVIENVKDEYKNKLKSAEAKKEVVAISKYAASSSYICFNNQDKGKFFSNANIRKAFSLAIDREGYVKNVVKKDVAAYGWVPYGVSCGNRDYRKSTVEPLKAIMNENPKALLQKGLKELGLDPNKKYTVTFLQGNSNAGTKTQGEFFQSQWESKLGVNVNIDAASDGATFNQMVMKGTFQVCQTGWGGDYNDPMTFMELFVTGGGNNSIFLNNKEYNSLIKKASTEPDMKKRYELFKKAEKILIVDEAGIAPLTYSFKNTYMQSYVKGLEMESFGPSYEFKHAYIDKK